MKSIRAHATVRRGIDAALAIASATAVAAGLSISLVGAACNRMVAQPTPASTVDTFATLALGVVMIVAGAAGFRRATAQLWIGSANNVIS